MTELLNFSVFSGLQTFAECPEKTEGQILNWRDVYESTVDLHGRRDADEYGAAAHPLCDFLVAFPGAPCLGGCAEGRKVVAVPVVLPSNGEG